MCITELGRVVYLKDDFIKRGVKFIVLLCDGVEFYKGWIKDITYVIKYEGEFFYLIIVDEGRYLVVKFGMIDFDEKDV